MDKSWMDESRFSREYYVGVNAFMEFALSNVPPGTNEIPCPCNQCLAGRYQSVQTVQNHLFQYGFNRGYTIWNMHGEHVQYNLPPPYRRNKSKHATTSSATTSWRSDRLYQDQSYNQNAGEELLAKLARLQREKIGKRKISAIFPDERIFAQTANKRLVHRAEYRQQRRINKRVQTTEERMAMERECKLRTIMGRMRKLRQEKETTHRMRHVKQVIEENTEIVDIKLDPDRLRENPRIAVLVGGSNIIVGMDSLSFRNVITRQLKDMVLEVLGLDPKMVPLCSGSRNKRDLEDYWYNMEATTLEKWLNVANGGKTKKMRREAAVKEKEMLLSSDDNKQKSKTASLCRPRRPRDASAGSAQPSPSLRGEGSGSAQPSPALRGEGSGSVQPSPASSSSFTLTPEQRLFLISDYYKRGETPPHFLFDMRVCFV